MVSLQQYVNHLQLTQPTAQRGEATAEEPTSGAAGCSLVRLQVWNRS